MGTLKSLRVVGDDTGVVKADSDTYNMFEGDSSCDAAGRVRAILDRAEFLKEKEYHDSSMALVHTTLEQLEFANLADDGNQNCALSHEDEFEALRQFASSNTEDVSIGD